MCMATCTSCDTRRLLKGFDSKEIYRWKSKSLFDGYVMKGRDLCFLISIGFKPMTHLSSRWDKQRFW